MRTHQVNELARSIRRQVPPAWLLALCESDPALTAGRIRQMRRLVDLCGVVAEEDRRRLARQAQQGLDPDTLDRHRDARRACRRLRVLRARLNRTMRRLARKPIYRFLIADRPVRELGPTFC